MGSLSTPPESAGQSSVPNDRQSIDEALRADTIGPKRDLSDRPTREERRDRLRGDRVALMADMAAALAHEINQPLTAAANYLFAVRRHVGGNPAALAALDKTEAQLVRAGRIVSRLREFMAHGEPETVTQSLHEVIRGARELAAPALKQANVDLNLRLEAAQDLVLADRIEIERALVSLIGNAIKAVGGSADGMVTIATSLANGAIQIDIADWRPGLSESTDAELVEPLNWTNVGSLGDELRIARAIIEAHRGSAWAAPRRGGGAIFSFALPLVGQVPGGA
jgi:C4-dicarboxylate-specific signal transduction histidine kinase